MAWKRDKNDVKESYKAWMEEGYRKKKSEYDKEHQKDPIVREEKRRRGKERYWEMKRKFFEMYGDSCACCGETTKEFLTMEHIKPCGSSKRVHGANQYKEAILEYRPDLYETLCMNCNHAIGRVGYCPHNPLRRVKGINQNE